MTYKSPSRHHDPETNIDDKELEAELRHYSPPPPSDLLQARILKICTHDTGGWDTGAGVWRTGNNRPRGPGLRIYSEHADRRPSI